MFAKVRISTTRMLCAILLVCIGLSHARATETILHNFDTNYSSGAYPVGQLAVSGSTFYGVTEYGLKGSGNIFTMTTAGVMKVIHEFAGGVGDGYYPNSGLVASGGNFYGTTLGGGTANVGIIYEISPTGTFTLLHSFTGYNSTTPANSDGSSPYAGLLVASDGNLYGVTYTGGNQNQGTVFTIKPDGTGYKLIHNFNNTVDMAYYPLNGLAESATGVLYGSTYYASGFYGGVYKLNKDGSGYTFVQGFSVTAPSAYYPTSDLVKASDGNLYGFCANGGLYGLGAVFKIVPGATDTVSTLWSFDGYTGAYPYWSNSNYNPQNRLLVGSDHNLYGVTRQGGANGYGTAFKLTLAGACTRLTSFSSKDALGTANPLIQSGSSFYATSYFGGASAVLGGRLGAANGYGSAVSIASSGALKVIQSFYLLDGYNPYSNLVQVGTGSAAAFYGVTYYGGDFGDGTIFKINSAGVFKVIHHLDDDNLEGYYPAAGLTLGRDGALYGTTTGGGKYSYGTIFKVTTAGALTVIHSFQNVEGYSPQAPLVQGLGKDNNLYGTCYNGGPPNGSGDAGSIFSINTTGTTFSVLRYLSTLDGIYPECQLVPDGLGNLYGTAYEGGANGYGTIFKVATNGKTFSKLFDFFYSSTSSTYPAGAYPQYGGSLVLTGGFLYGVTADGGKNNNGVIFQCNVSTGATTSFHDFNNSIGEGYTPAGGLFYSSTNGFFYGTTINGGTNGYGTIYKVKTTTGALTVLDTLTGYNSGNPPASDGANPYAGVILASDGFLYGTTVSGGDANYGIVFKQTP